MESSENWKQEKTGTDDDVYNTDEGKDKIIIQRVEVGLNNPIEFLMNCEREMDLLGYNITDKKKIVS